MDQGSRILRRAILTAANVNESERCERLICGDEATVYGDKAYDSNARRARLKSRRIRDGSCDGPIDGTPLGRWNVRRNAIISRCRAPIEPLFAWLKNGHRFARARYRGLARNHTALQLIALAMNLRRWAKCAPAPA